MLKASLKFRMDSLHGDMPASRTEYILGRNTRKECRSCSGHSETLPPTNVRYEYGPLRAYIQNRDLQYGFEIDLDEGVYTAWRSNEYGGPTWIKPRRIERREEPSGSTVHGHAEFLDTGDRRTVFGYTARRVITKGTSRRDSELASESESDGWYIDAPPAWLNLHPPAQPGIIHVVGSGTNKRDDFTFTQKGERETGFPILLARVDRSYFRDQDGVMRSHESSSRDEVTEFAEATLDLAVFIPPRDFKRVMQLSGGMRYPLSNRLRVRWEMLKDSRQLRRSLTLARRDLAQNRVQPLACFRL
jgi:hypothetical protein